MPILILRIQGATTSPWGLAWLVKGCIKNFPEGSAWVNGRGLRLKPGYGHYIQQQQNPSQPFKKILNAPFNQPSQAPRAYSCPTNSQYQYWHLQPFHYPKKKVWCVLDLIGWCVLDLIDILSTTQIILQKGLHQSVCFSECQDIHWIKFIIYTISLVLEAIIITFS